MSLSRPDVVLLKESYQAVNTPHRLRKLCSVFTAIRVAMLKKTVEERRKIWVADRQDQACEGSNV